MALKTDVSGRGNPLLVKGGVAAEQPGWSGQPKPSAPAGRVHLSFCKEGISARIEFAAS